MNRPGFEPGPPRWELPYLTENTWLLDFKLLIIKISIGFTLVNEIVSTKILPALNLRNAYLSYCGVFLIE
jgi:hypothetical protein